ncbi:HEAT repeat-containing protein 4 isoform X1 [Alligator sinensis]|uniref:HEAT repeat-containing protein 4 isoform X1 n=3 Tax=Alligator sinensis TaxID=38654 RepID=A0A3Q0HKQ7_ALLSI|nr:HEAT repeat-containing protein 4 isoform X1 [Alligator sinensis]
MASLDQVCFPVAEARYFTSARRMNISTLCSSNNPFAIDDKLRVTLSESHEPSGHFQSCSNSPVDLQTTKTTRPLQDTCLSQPCYSQCYVKYLKKIATDLRFSKEVVKHRGLPTLPYKECDFKYLYDASGIIQKPQNKESIAKKVGQPLKLHPLKQPPCLLKSDIPPPTGTREESLWRTKRQSSPSPLLHETPFSKTFLTESHEMSSTAVTRRGQEKKVSPGDASVSRIRCQGWEEMLLKKLNRTTAQWIVNQQATWGGWIQDKPHSFTKQKFDWNRIRDELSSESDLKLLDEIQAGEDAMEVSSQSQAQQKPETLLPVYYRLPAYCTRVLPADDPVGYNSTADETERKCLRPASPMKKWERPTSCLRKYTYAAKNAFEHELYFGTVKIVHQMDKRGKDCFILENHDEYYKHLQQHFPRPPVHWSFQPQKAAQKPEKGAFRWTALPTQADDFVQRGQEPPQAKTSKGRKEPKESKAGLPEDMHILRTMLEQWKNAWKLTPQWQNATIEGLTRALTDIHDVVRVSAIITCASAVVERPRSDTSNQESVVEIDGTGKVPEIQDVPEELQPLLKKTLRHESAHVRMAAAVCHYATGMRNEEARAVMQDALVHGNSADSWAAAQCLALDGIITLPVVTKILSQLFDKNDETTEKQACLLLTQLSERTSLVYSLLAAKLNSCQWKDRILACKALSRIRGYVSQDLKNKLVQLMWKDWKLDVRQAAALALGHMKFGKEVHDQLRVKLKRGDCRTKVEALSLIGWLRFMTAKLLPGFLQCFSNDFVAVRREACLTAGALRIKDETVLKCLLKTMQTDPHWKIKAFAIRALGQIGHVSPQLKRLLLWAVHYEEKPGVRKEACRAIVTLHLQDESVQATLLERVILEPNEMVREEINQAMKALNFQHKEDQKTVEKIKNEISSLSQKALVTQKLLKLEEIIDHLWQKADRIYHAEEHSSDYKDILENLRAALESTSIGESYSSTTMTSKIWTPNSGLPVCASTMRKLHQVPGHEKPSYYHLNLTTMKRQSCSSKESIPAERGQPSSSLCR